MNNIIDDEFRISNYLSNNQKESYSYSNESVEIAKQWSLESGKVIITPTKTLQELEDTWIRFNEMIRKNQRESDWKSLELFGCTNYQHYDFLRNKLLIKNIENDEEIENGNEYKMQLMNSGLVSESYIDSYYDYYESDSISYTTEDVEKAREWAKESDKTIIIPTRNLVELESLWDSYNMMIKKHKRESDWMSMELFGVTNLRHYEYLKNQFLKEDIRGEDVDKYGSLIESATSYDIKKYYKSLINESVIDRASALLESFVPNKGIYEETITGNIISDVLDSYDSDVFPSTPEVICGDMPYFDSDEMIDMGVFGSSPSENYYGVLADNTYINDSLSVKDWFESYVYTNKGYRTDFPKYTSDWVNKVRELSFGLKRIKESKDEKAILARKQSLLELGWDPDIEFNNRSRIIAKEAATQRICSLYSDRNIRVIDLSGFSSNTSCVMNESIQSGLRAIYVCLIEGQSNFSKMIKSITKDIYSHSALSLDPDLHNMYSYKIDKREVVNGRSGFSIESIKNIPIGSRIGIYTFFVTDSIYNKIKEFINKFKENAAKTSYSFINLVTYLFNIPLDREWSLICSQFVDRCLQAADINLTGKKSSQIAPSDINKAMHNQSKKSESRIYKIYEGLASSYNPKKIESLVNSLITKAKPLKENNNIYYENEKKYISGVLSNIRDINSLFEMQDHLDIVENPIVYRVLSEVLFDSINIRPYGEAKEFPIQFDKEGNLLIKNLKKLDYEAEYAKSHKLLKEYQKSNNIEGMKYELSKLWMINCLIEEKLNSKKFKELPSMAIISSNAHKARAKIINDFKYYLAIIMKADEGFNFTDYYDKSPFSQATIKIDATTMDYVGKMIKTFIKSI